MRQILILVGVVLCLSVPASAQGPAGAGTGVGSGRHSRSPSELSKWQLTFGYQFNRINLLGKPFNTNGLNVSTVRYFGKRIGAEAQVGGGFGNTGATTVPPSLTVKSLFAGAARTSRFAAMAGSNPGHTPSSEWNFSVLARRQGCLEITRDWQEWAVAA